jgi:type IV secretion system protein TrbG
MNPFTLWRATLCFGLLTIAVTPAFAQNMSLTEERAMGLSGHWREGQGTVTRGPDGKVVFLFGQVQPSVVCSPLHVCDI